MTVHFDEMQAEDKEAVISLMRGFYASDAVHTNGSEEIFAANVDNCVNDCPYLEGYTIRSGEDIIGYSMLAKSFSTEFGRECIWIEDLFLKEEYRNKGIITEFISFIKKKYKGKLFRIEAEENNARANHVYQKTGFKILPYVEYYYGD